MPRGGARVGAGRKRIHEIQPDTGEAKQRGRKHINEDGEYKNGRDYFMVSFKVPPKEHEDVRKLLEKNGTTIGRWIMSLIRKEIDLQKALGVIE